MKKLFQLGALIALVIVLVAGWGIWKVHQMGNSAVNISQETVYTLEPGTGRTALGADLYTKKLIYQPRVFQWLLRINPELAHFKAGTYQLVPGMTVYDLMMLLNSGKEVQFSVRMIEGQRVSDFLKTIRKSPYIKHTLSDDHYETLAIALKLNGAQAVEGWFKPDTWSYTAGTTDLAILQRAHQRMLLVVKEIWDKRTDGLPYHSPAELVTMASIIEKETALAAERPKVASVFINRLRIGMRLQTDPTVIYGMGESYSGKITRNALTTPTPYNTYIISGLPPTPIAAPGLASLYAAAMPDKTPYLYFVADGKGGHTFSTNLAKHNQAVQAYLRAFKEKNER